MPDSLLPLSRAIQSDPLHDQVALILIRNNPTVPSQTDLAQCSFADTIDAPLDASKVFDALARVSMARRGPVIAARTSPPDRQAAKSHILIAEDNLINQKLLRRLLEKLGHSVEVAANGREAVEKWAAGSYDLILMDCQMPEMDGYEATREIRIAEGGRTHIPVIAVTANAMPADRQKCLTAGMDAFVSKPIKMEALIKAVEQFLALAADGPSTFS
jgi:CheY-like chemotaxis protein